MVASDQLTDEIEVRLVSSGYDSLKVLLAKVKIADSASTLLNLAWNSLKDRNLLKAHYTFTSQIFVHRNTTLLMSETFREMDVR